VTELWVDTDEMNVGHIRLRCGQETDEEGDQLSIVILDEVAAGSEVLKEQSG
jgi:hypothetical protein